MKRRRFLELLGLAPLIAKAAPLLAKIPAAPAVLNIDDLFKQIYALKRARLSAAPQLLTVNWIQTERTSTCCNEDYLDALDRIYGATDPVTRQRRWQNQLKERCRANIAKLKSESPMPLP